jgi:hypothetical protein
MQRQIREHGGITMALLKKSSLFLLAVFLIVPPTTAAQPDSDGEPLTSETGRQAVEAWLNTISKDHPTVPPKILAVDDKVRTVFPDDYFYAIRYMRYPRAVKPPESLKLENLVRVRRDGTVHRIENLDALKELFAKQLGAVKSEAEARSVLLAFLQLAQEFYQDGEYTFSVPEDSISIVRKGNALIATGKSVVTKGGQGEITAILNTDDPNKAEVNSNVRSGVRLR